MEYSQIIAIIVTLAVFISVAYAGIENYKYEKTCDKVEVCYYFTGGGLFSSESKIYVDCNKTYNIPSSEKIIKSEECK